jgi:hypothetical protein
MTLKFLDVIFLKIIELIVELLMLLKPKLHHWRSICAILIKNLPSSRPFELFNSYIVLAHWLVFPFETTSINLIPERECHFKLQVVVLFLAIGTNKDICFCDINCFILNGCATTYIMPVSILYFYED